MRSLAFILLIGAACGGAGTRTVQGSGGPERKQKRDPIKPEARKEFESAMRAVRLGGPEAADTARGRLHAAVKADGSVWEAWYDLGVLAWKQGDDDEAIEDFNQALAKNHDHTPIVLARAEAHRRAGHKKDARADYEAALKAMEEEDPNRKDTAARLASLLRDGGDFDDAVSVIRDTVRVSGANAKIYTELGQIYIARKQLDLAQLVLAKAVGLDANDPAIWNALAILSLRQGKAQEAFERFDKAVSLDASYLDARFNKASVLLDAGDYARAKAELSAIVQRNKEDYAAYVALGVAQRGLKEFPEAKKSWELVIKEAPKRSTTRADAMWNLSGLKLDFLNDQDGGKADLVRYLQEAPSSHAKRQDAEDKCRYLKCS
ncbi:MAG: Tetratricopeptide 2 repeat protein [Myxococcales bacterium]|nr:Tetratricopeptide 2 repeat protein [Myxococcales bacterium]